MQRLFFVIITLFFFILNSSHSYAYEKEIKTLSSIMADNIVKAGKKTIAVVDFVDLQGNVTELGRFLAEEFSVAFAGAGKGFEVVDRTHLKSILAEHKLSATGIIDPQTARKLGQVVGVDALITGTITSFGDSVRLSVKILDTATAKVIRASSCDIAKTRAIEELLAKSIEIGRQPTVSGPPALPHPIAKHSIKVRNFTFELIEAKTDGTSATCDILITNNDQTDRYIQIFKGQTTLFDNFGNEYKAEVIYLGTKKSGSDFFGHYAGEVVHQLLVTGVPTSAKVISQISPKAEKIALLQIFVGASEDAHGHTGARSDQAFKVEFRNIPLTR